MAPHAKNPFRYPEAQAWCDVHGGFGPWDGDSASLNDPLGRSPTWDFTQCFQETIVNNVPYMLLALLGTFRYIYLLHRRRAASQHVDHDTDGGHQIVAAAGWHLAVKATLVVAFAAVCVAQYMLVGSGEGIVLLLLIAHIVVLALALALTLVEHMRSLRSSDTLLLFWLLAAVAYAFDIKNLVHVNRIHEPLGFAIAQSSIALVAFVLELLPKARGEYELVAGEDRDHDDEAAGRVPSAADHAAETLDRARSDREISSGHGGGKPSPQESATIFSRISFWWLNPLVKVGQQQILSARDLWRIPTSISAKYNHHRFHAVWNRMIRDAGADPYSQDADGKPPSLGRALIRVFGPLFMVTSMMKAVQDVLAFMQPLLLKQLIHTTTVSGGVWVSAGMLVTALAQSILINQYFQLCMEVGMRVRTALVSAIYHKALRLSLNAKGRFSTGQLVTHMSVDAQKLEGLTTYLNIVWSGPFQILLALNFLWIELGPSMLAGLLIMILAIPVNAAIARRQQAVQKDQMSCKDGRLKLMDELLSGIKVIKLYAWEKFFLNRIDGIRQRELRNLKRYGYLSACSGFTWMCTPFLVAFASFGVYLLTETEPLTPAKAFVSLTLFNLLKFPLSMFPNVINSCVEARVSMQRLRRFLTMPEIHSAYLVRKPRASPSSTVRPIAVRVQGTYAWNAGPVLHDLDLACLVGELVCIVGKVGSGKSSVLSAILGEMEAVPSAISERPSGIPHNVEVCGSVGYVSDDSWILNASIRENILFGKPLDEDWYSEVIHATCLDSDLSVLPDGDLCMVGEKGVSLSGGQKKRVAIARAVYAQQDVYLLDDPLSALDAHVSRRVFDACFGPDGLLRDKCRILVTHQTQVLNQADMIVNMKDGRISESGNFAHVVSLNGDVVQLLNAVNKRAATSDALPSASPAASLALDPTTQGDAKSVAGASTSSAVLLKKQAQQAAPRTFVINKSTEQQITAEGMSQGSVSSYVYMLYFRACTWRGVILFLAATILAQTLSISSNVWLQYSVSHVVDSITFLSVYGMIGIAFSTSAVIAILVIWVICGIRSARTLHNNMLSRVAAYPMVFFDTQPIGRILNRFSKDINTVDEVLVRSFQSMCSTFITVFSVVVLIASYSPVFIVVIIPLMVLYYFIQRYYLGTSRELKRLDSVSRSPVFSHFAQTLDGLHVLRAFQQEKRFVRECHARIDDNLRANYLSMSANRWLAVRLEFLGAIVVFATALLMVLSRAEASVIGLTLSYALTTTSSLNWMVRQYCEIETNIVSVERIHEYCELPTEAPALLSTRPAPHWPDKGEVVFDNFSARYRPGLDLVLRDVSISIPARAKVGLCGRTGSGKSSAFLSLFRIIDPAAEGRILIDGVDITQVGLYDLRSRLTIIPQDPILFSGTIRQNLDPFEQHDDAAIWQALELVQLKPHVAQLPGKLSYAVSHGGVFSLGQRQLICLARALLRHSQIIVLDEATAQVDVSTDRIIQETIRTQFRHCTILTIAHRINTVIDSDLILVLSSGRVLEFDSPDNLLKRPDSAFRALVDESGLH